MNNKHHSHMDRRSALKIKTNKKAKRKKSSNLYSNIDWDKVVKIFQNTKPYIDKSSRYPSSRELLHYLAAAAGIGLVFAFPGAAPAISNIFNKDKTYPPWRTKQIIKQLEKQKFVDIKENSDGAVTVTITRNGMARALTYQLETLKLGKPKKWDHKWRVVIFDIPDKYRRIRDLFRKRLRQLNLYQLQESVYVSPTPCFDEIEFLRELYGVAITVRYLLVEKVENDKELRQYFKVN